MKEFRRSLLAASILLLAMQLPATPEVNQNCWKQNSLFITFCCAPPASDANMKRIADQGFNLVPTSEEALPFAEKYGLKITLQHGLLHPSSLDDPVKREQLDALIDRVSRSPAMDSYYLYDEPQQFEFPTWARLAEYLRKRDPAHWSYINLHPIYAKFYGTKGDQSSIYENYLSVFVKKVKPAVLSYDHYHFFKNKYLGFPEDGKQYFLNLALIREAAIAGQIPFNNIIQASTYDRNWRMPTENELRWLIYTTLAYGGRGISYFLYWGPEKWGGFYREGKSVPVDAALPRLNSEIAALSPFLMNKQSLHVYHSGPLPEGCLPFNRACPIKITSQGEFVLGLFGKSTAAIDSFMIVNRSYSNAETATFSTPPANLERFETVTREWIKCKPNKDHQYSVNLQPGQGQLFRFAAK